MKSTVLYATGLGLMIAATGCPSDPVPPDANMTTNDAFVAPGTDVGVDAATPSDTGPVVIDTGTVPSDTNTTDAFMPSGDCSLSGYPALSLENIAPSPAWSRPVHIAQPVGSTDLYVVDQRGIIYVVRGGAVESTPFIDMRTNVGTLGGIGDERGLLSIAFHPEYATNGRFFVGYTPIGTAAGAVNIVAEGSRSAGNPLVANTTLTTLISIPDFASNHNGGMLVFGPDGFLYIGTGDGGGGGDPMRTSQNPNNLLGKMLRIDVNTSGVPYASPPSNPYIGMAGIRPEIWAFGYRNPWRFSFDRMTREMYIADVGQNRFEEVDIEAPGSGGHNYGWSAFEGRAAFGGGSPLRAGDTHAAPVLDIAHDSRTTVLRSSCSITGGFVYRGTAIRALRGAYIFGDYCSSDIAAFRYCDGAVREPMRLDMGGGVDSVVSFGEDNMGELYVINGTSVRRIIGR